MRTSSHVSLPLSAHPGLGGTFSGQQEKTLALPEDELEKVTSYLMLCATPRMRLSVWVGLVACNTAKPFIKITTGSDPPPTPSPCCDSLLCWVCWTLDSTCQHNGMSLSWHWDCSTQETLGLATWNFPLRFMQHLWSFDSARRVHR